MIEEARGGWVESLKSPEWVWRLVMILGGVAMLYMQSRYVTRAEYVIDRKDNVESLNAISRSMNGVQTSLELLRQNANTLLDHETRIRVLEHERRP